MHSVGPCTKARSRCQNFLHFTDNGVLSDMQPAKSLAASTSSLETAIAENGGQAFAAGYLMAVSQSVNFQKQVCIAHMNKAYSES